MLVSASLTSSFVSCDKNEENNEPDNSISVVGKWQKYQVIEEDGTISYGDSDEFWIYQSDGTFQNEDGGNITTVGTYKVEDNVLTIYSHDIEEVSKEENFTGTFSISNGSMTYKFTEMGYSETLTYIFKKM